MGTERSRELRKAVDDQTAELARQVQESGELRHLYGKPLQIVEDDEWLGVRIIRESGFSHPALERARELAAPREAAQRVIDRVRRRRAWLASPESKCTPQRAHQFNLDREKALVEYRECLQTLNVAIRDYNLGVPDALHRVPVPIDATMERVAAEIPPLQWEPAPGPVRRRRRFWFR